MGDRAQIIIEREGKKIYFYTHWRGTELPRILAAGLERGQSRWTDPSYLGRIIFCTLIEGSNLQDTTGYGIGTQYGDSFDDTDLIVDMDKKRVRYLNASWTFQEYVDLPTHSWRALKS